MSDTAIALLVHFDRLTEIRRDHGEPNLFLSGRIVADHGAENKVTLGGREPPHRVCRLGDFTQGQVVSTGNVQNDLPRTPNRARLKKWVAARGFRCRNRSLFPTPLSHPHHRLPRA